MCTLYAVLLPVQCFQRNDQDSLIHKVLQEIRNKQAHIIITINIVLHWMVVVQCFKGNQWHLYHAGDSLTDDGEHSWQMQHILLGTPFYNADTDTWNKVDSIRQTEAECGSRACLAGMILALANKPQHVLSMLQCIQKLQDKARRVVAHIYKEHCCDPETWLKKICTMMSNGTA